MLTITDTAMIADIAKHLTDYTHEYKFEYSQDPKSSATADAKFWAEKCEKILTDYFANQAK